MCIVGIWRRTECQSWQPSCGWQGAPHHHTHRKMTYIRHHHCACTTTICTLCVCIWTHMYIFMVSSTSIFVWSRFNVRINCDVCQLRNREKCALDMLASYVPTVCIVGICRQTEWQSWRQGCSNWGMWGLTVLSASCEIEKSMHWNMLGDLHLVFS